MEELKSFVGTAKSVWEAADGFMGSIVKLSIALGCWYLLVYCASNNIPFPIRFSELPALLIGVGFLGSMIAVVMAGFFLLIRIGVIPAFASEYETLYPRVLLAPDEEGKSLSGPRRKSIFRTIGRFLLLLGLPVFFIILSIISSAIDPSIGIGKFGFLVLGIIAFVLGVYPHHKKTEVLVVAVMHFLIGLIWSVTLFQLLVGGLAGSAWFSGLGDVLQVTLILLILVAIIGGLGAMVIEGRRSNDDEAAKHQRRWLIFGAFLVGVSMIYPVTNRMIGASAMRALNIGGAIPLELRISKDAPEDIRKRLQVTDNETARVCLLLELEAYTYLRMSDGGTLQIPDAWIVNREPLAKKEGRTARVCPKVTPLADG